MKRIASIVIEEAFLLAVFVFTVTKFSERIPSNETVWLLGIIVTRNIIVAKAIEHLIEQPYKSKLLCHISRLLLSFLLISFVLFADFWAACHFCGLSATMKTLLVICCGYTCCHLLLSSVLDNLLGVKRGFLMDFIIKDNDAEDIGNEEDI